MMSRTFFVLAIIGALSLLAGHVRAQSEQRCFPETGFCISGQLRAFWERQGGLPVFGFPTDTQHRGNIEGTSLQAQWFERTRLELHPENSPPYEVLLGRIGVERLEQQGRDWHDFPVIGPGADCRTFSETGHSICRAFLSYWEEHGFELDGQPGVSYSESLALFGLPLSDIHIEEIEGRAFLVQWFERARFELHPENSPPYNVLLGLLGNEVRVASTASPTNVLPTITLSITPTRIGTPTPTRRSHRDDEPPTSTEAPLPTATASPAPLPSATASPGPVRTPTPSRIPGPPYP
jgi:hypothetical protein